MMYTNHVNEIRRLVRLIYNIYPSTRHRPLHQNVLHHTSSSSSSDSNNNNNNNNIYSSIKLHQMQIS